MDLNKALQVVENLKDSAYQLLDVNLEDISLQEIGKDNFNNWVITLKIDTLKDLKTFIVSPEEEIISMKIWAPSNPMFTYDKDQNLLLENN